jgi:hypothetical protein
MVDRLRFVLIMSIIPRDDAPRALVGLFDTTRDFVRYRLRWVVRDVVLDKLRKMWVGWR